MKKPLKMRGFSDPDPDLIGEKKLKIVKLCEPRWKVFKPTGGGLKVFV